ncbi:hypothetical protein ADIS_2281 [Lunatimonas lonarensis]|uniref:Uncharacterized protein n=1 Tax=Lunatimonas lonarensis TaxID=1232681 RepID=R7ZSS4_9BACT|nr:hypothetical protein ADIS_2281 [Lunatimonas lonarensis]
MQATAGIIFGTKGVFVLLFADREGFGRGLVFCMFLGIFFDSPKIFA